MQIVRWACIFFSSYLYFVNKKLVNIYIYIYLQVINGKMC